MTTNTTNANTDRKALAKELAAEIGAEVKYLGVPSCAYQVGPYTINKDASIAGGNLEAIRPFLIRHDYIHQEPAAPTMEPEANEDSEANNEEITETKISIPISELTPVSVTNLFKILYAKQKLISAMTQSDFIFIDEEVIELLNEEKPNALESISELVQSEARLDMIRGIDLDFDTLTIAFPYDGEKPTVWASYAKLLTALIARAKAAQHINSKLISPSSSEMKYYCNSLLMQLGFGGADYKADRAALLGHLPGYAAFKSADKMEAHKAKFSERRKAARLAAKEGASEQAEGDLEAGSGEGVVE